MFQSCYGHLMAIGPFALWIIAPNHIKSRREILQLLALDAIFSLPFSRKLLFQGGTCLRRVYNGTRYSEDLDFLGESQNKLDVNELQRKLEKILVKRLIVQLFHSLPARSNPSLPIYPASGRSMPEVFSCKDPSFAR